MQPPPPPFEDRLRALAAEAQYPATPDLVPAVTRRLTGRQRPRPARRLAWALVIVLAAWGVALASVPSARAGFLRVIRMGVVQIFVEPSPTARVTPTVAPRPTTSPVLRPPLDLAGATSLSFVREAMGSAIRLPTYPADLGEPDLAFYQNVEGELAVLVWLDPENPAQARLALHILGPGTFAGKSEMRLIEETEVGGRSALWLVGAHGLLLRNGDLAFRTIVQGNVLLWDVDGVTYRLETDRGLDEAVRIAESLR